MKRLLVLLLFPLSAFSAQSDLANMVQAEYDFAALCQTDGYKASFLKYLSDDAVMLENGPVNARKTVSGRPELKGSLEWYPSYAVVSSSGDIGLSTGPYVISNADKTKHGYGHFVSVWRKQPNGAWRNALDVGVQHPELKPAPEKLKVSAPTGHADSATTPRNDRAADIRGAEAQFAQLSSTTGYAAAAEQLAHADLRVYRDGHAPVAGTVEATPLLKENDIKAAPKVEYAAGSGDFGYSYGLVGRHQFLHVWRERSGKWQLLADLLLALPEEKSN